MISYVYDTAPMFKGISYTRTGENRMCLLDGGRQRGAILGDAVTDKSIEWQRLQWLGRREVLAFLGLAFESGQPVGFGTVSEAADRYGWLILFIPNALGSSAGRVYRFCKAMARGLRRTDRYCGTAGFERQVHDRSTKESISRSLDRRKSRKLTALYLQVS